MSIALLPFLILCLGLALLLIVDLALPKGRQSYQIALTTLVAALLTELNAMLGSLVPGPSAEVWKPIGQVLAFDPLAHTFSTLALFLAFVAVGISKDSFTEERTHSGEYYGLALTATLGAVLVAHSKELLTFFLAFELLSIPLYVLAGFHHYNRKSAEAGLKYFLAGALSSALFLFGASWVYGASGTTQFKELLNAYSQDHQQPLLLGVLLILSAFAFKLAAAPFHMWAPDTYEGAPIPVAAFLSTVPKSAMVAATIRLVLPLCDQLSDELMLVFASLAVLSIVIGNVVAITQSEITRMAAYSGIAQMGYLMIGISALVGIDGAGKPNLVQEFLGTLLFYLVVYTVTNLAFWLILLAVGKSKGSTRLDAFNGLSKTDPFLSFCLMIATFSLAGVPPLAGFVGKLYLFRAALYTQPIMAFFGVLGSVISLYYYFNILRRCYFLNPDEGDKPVQAERSLKLLVGGLLLLTFTSGLIPYFAEVCFKISEIMTLKL